jgi:hypothetical protein
MDLINVLASALTAWIVAVVALVPLAGLTARFGLKPVLDSVARLRAAGRGAPEMDERFTRLEEQIRALAGAVDRLAEGGESGRRSAESRTQIPA